MILATIIRGRLWFELHLSLSDFWIGVRWERHGVAPVVTEVTVCVVPCVVVWVHWRGE